MLPCRDEILSLTKQLTRFESIVNTPGEREISQYIYEWISSLSYFQHNPHHVLRQRTRDDERERYNVLAFVKGTKATSSKTVILMGHMDTVGTDDYNQDKEIACDPDQLMHSWQNESLPSTDLNEQLKSGEWLFGRGTLDMKSGLASHLYLLKYYSEHPQELAGNIVLVAECDEEDSSHGILSALPQLKQWQGQYYFDYAAAINAEFVSPRFEGDPNRYIYKGTVGKLLPSFFITGAETHVGATFEGIDPNFIAAELTRQINYNPDLCDQAFGEMTMPPVSLKQTDLKPFYTVQTALFAYVYYNFYIHSWSPRDVLHKLKQQAEMAFERALAIFHERHQQFCAIRGESAPELPWKSRVLTYEEMNQWLVEENGKEYTLYMASFKEKLLAEKMDVRQYAAKVVEEAWKWMRDKSPAIILFYSSLYSPRVEVTGKDEQERKLIDALEQAIVSVQPEYAYPIVTRNFYPYISDMSFISLSDEAHGVEAVIHNNPAWGKKHFVEYQDIRDLNVPVINIGPYGHDAHKKFERMECEYSLHIVPNLTRQVIKNVLE